MNRFLGSKMGAKRGIALLTTVLFIMLITLSIGVGLKYLKQGNKSVYSEQRMMQTSSIASDVLSMMKISKGLQAVKTAEDLYVFLEYSEVLPFFSDGTEVLVEIKSARAKINPNTLLDSNTSRAFEIFLSNKQIDIQYKYMLLDLLNGIKNDAGYNTDIFNEKPYLFRDYVSSLEHLSELTQLYEIRYRSDSLKKINLKELFYITSGSDYKIDLNYVTPLTWEFLLGCSQERALVLSQQETVFNTLEDLQLTLEEQSALKKFKFDFFQPYLAVKVKLFQGKYTSEIEFEYDITNKKGYNFVFKV